MIFEPECAHIHSSLPPAQCDRSSILAGYSHKNGAFFPTDPPLARMWLAEILGPDLPAP